MRHEEYPRVVDLSYRIETSESHEYAQGARLDGQLSGFRFALLDRSATFQPDQRFATEEEARSLLEPQLRAWEIASDLEHGPGTLTFKYLNTHVQHHAPRPGVIEARGISASTSIGHATVRLIHNQHPSAPKDFSVNECVEDLAAIYRHARGDRQSVLKDAYSMVTRLEFEFGGRLKEAATALRVSQNVLPEMRQLATTRGTGAEVRKFKTAVARAPLTDAEHNWLLALMKALVQRAGTLAAGAEISSDITLASLPAKS